MPRATVLQLMGWRSQQYGSIERFLVRLGDAIDAGGDRLHVAFHNEPASRAFLDDLKAEVHVLPAPEGPADRRFVGGMRALLRAVGPTHVHAHFGLDAYVGLGMARAMGVPHRFYSKHIRAGGWRTLAPVHHRWLAAQVEQVIAVSEDVAGHLARNGVPRDKLTVIRFGVDPAAYRAGDEARARVREELGVAPGDRLVLSTSHLRPGKGVDLLPPLAVALREDPGSTMVALAGDGVLREQLGRDAAALGLTDREFRLLGVRQDVPALLAAADAFVFPTHWFPEGNPLGALEGLASGAPVVATAVSDLPIVLAGAAELITPGDGQALIDATRRALADGRTPEREAAVQKALAGIDPQETVAAHLRHYGLAATSS